MRASIATLCCALTSTILPTVAASAATVTARDISTACPAEHVTSAGFRDTRGSTFEHEIDCVVAYAIAKGTTTDLYEPGRTVSREQMATFLANTLRAAGRSRPSGLPNAFPDDDRSSHRANIDWLASEGVIGGFSDGTFRPGEMVTRAQMASFLNNVVRELTGSRLRSETDFFADDETSTHEDNINGLARHGIVTGTGDDVFAPGGLVTRGQMAGFLAREVDYLVDNGHVRVPFGPREITVTPTTAVNLDASDNSASKTSDRGRRSYTVDVPFDIDRVSIILMPVSQVATARDGSPRFTAPFAAPANAGVSIEVVDGQTVDQANGSSDRTQVNDIVVGSDSRVTFTIDANVITSVIPVVFADTVSPSRDELDLESGASSSNPKPALEPVGVGGRTSWGPPEPKVGTDLPTGTVRDVNLAAGWYALDTEGGSSPDWLIRYASGDDYRYTASGEPVANSPGPITRSQFEAWLSAGDRVNPSAYDPGRTTHVISGDVPSAPTGFGASILTDGRVRLTFAKPTNPVADDKASSFRLQRAPVTSGAIGSFTEVMARSADQTPEFTDTPPSNGTFAYRVISRSVTGDSPASATVQVTVSAPAPATTGSRIAVDNGPGNSGSANRILDNGDRIELTFDRAITVSSGWSVVLLDVDGTQVRLESPNVTPTVAGSSGNVLTLNIGSGALTLLADGANKQIDIAPGTSNASTTGFLQVLSATAIGNGSGVWNLPKSGLGSPFNNSRVIIDGSGSGTLTPVMPTGHLVGSAAGSKVEAGVDEVQTITVATNATGGTWTLTFGGKTATLAHDANAAAVQAGLEALSSIGTGNVVVTGGPIASSAVTVRFTGTLGALNQPALVVDGKDLTAPSGQTVTAPAVSTVVEGQAVSGIVAGDRVSVHTTGGSLLGSAVAGANGRTTVALAPPVVAGQTVYVVVEQASTLRRSRTATVVVG